MHGIVGVLVRAEGARMAAPLATKALVALGYRGPVPLFAPVGLGEHDH